VYKVDLLASRSCNAQITSIYIRAPNAWLCRIQREDFEIVLGSKVAERRFEGWISGPATKSFNRAGQRYQSPDTPPHSALSIFKDLWLPSFLQFRFPARLLFRLPYFRFYSLSRPENFALQIKTPTLLRIIDIKQLLESMSHLPDSLSHSVVA
jgi:hypothetical protein